jgi:DnaJ like chaperone protein
MIRILLFVMLFIIYIAFKIIQKAAQTTIDTGKDAYESIRSSNSFEEAYRNFSTNRFARARLGIPEEVIALMAKVSISDGKVSELEVEYMSDMVKAIAAAMLASGMNEQVVAEVKTRLFELANQAKKDTNPISFYCAELSQSSKEIRIRAFMQILSFASLDGLSSKTSALLYEIGTCLRFTTEELNHFINSLTGQKAAQDSSAKNPYQVLGCSESDDFSVIKQAYRRLVKQHHPDYMHSKGLDDSEIRKATEKMQEINNAYEEIKKRKPFP